MWTQFTVTVSGLRRRPRGGWRSATLWRTADRAERTRITLASIRCSTTATGRHRPITDSNRNAHGYANGDSDSHGDGDGHSDGHSDGDGHGDANSDRYSCTNTNADSNPCTGRLCLYSELLEEPSGGVVRGNHNARVPDLSQDEAISVMRH